MNLWHLQRAGCRPGLLIRRPCLTCQAEVRPVKPSKTKFAPSLIRKFICWSSLVKPICQLHPHAGRLTLCLLPIASPIRCWARSTQVKPGKTKGSTGHWPVSSGDPPDETEKRICLVAIPLETCSAFLHAGRRVSPMPGRGSAARPGFGRVKPGKTKNITIPNQPEGLWARVCF